MVTVEELISAEVDIREASHFRPFANFLWQEAQPATRSVQRVQAVLCHLSIAREMTLLG